MKYCRKCGKELSDDSVFCDACGTKVVSAGNDIDRAGVQERSEYKKEGSFAYLNGYRQLHFDVGGRRSTVICPDEPLPGNPWVWRTEFFEAFNYADFALLKKGWHLAYHCVSDMYGCPESIEMMKEFYDYVTSGFRLHERPAIFGFSRGGLYAVNFALKYPDCCGLLYLDAPVLDIRSWPGGLGAGRGEPGCWEECKRVYHLNENTAFRFSDAVAI